MKKSNVYLWAYYSKAFNVNALSGDTTDYIVRHLRLAVKQATPLLFILLFSAVSGARTTDELSVEAATSAITGNAVQADGFPFDTCPTEAFLIQDTVATLYGVKLATGQYQQLSNTMGTNSKLNAMGFNFHDQYLYAWSYEFAKPVQINNAYQVTPLTTSGLPGVSFYVGDISIESNVYIAPGHLTVYMLSH
ncbi:MAG: hypothetical protein ACI97K_003058 [Glaciecola sp.]|jgi:hypothetical protein